MYNEQLETLIDAALADGVLTEKEKQILFKKAQTMGVDLDEFEMVLDARLVKLQKAEQEKAASSAPKSNKFGDVKKCPACGAMVQSYQGICPECGYAFERLEANSSVQKLAKAIEQATSDGKKRYDVARKQENELKGRGVKKSFFDHEVHDDTDEMVAKAISSFPVPNTKADLMEFILSLEPKTKSSDEVSDSIWKAYREKYEECIRKAKYVFPKDPQFAPLLADYDAKNKGLKGWWNRKSSQSKLGFYILAGNIILWTVLALSGVFE